MSCSYFGRKMRSKVVVVDISGEGWLDSKYVQSGVGQVRLCVLKGWEMSVAGKAERAARQGESQYVNILDPSKQGCMQPQLRYAIRVRLRLRYDAMQYRIRYSSNLSRLAAR